MHVRPSGKVQSRLAAIAFGTVLLVSVTAPSADAAVTIGQLAPGTSPPTYCTYGPADAIQAPVTSGNSYVVPGTGTITSWSHNAAAGAGQMLTMKIFRPVSGSTVFSVVGHDGPRNLTPSVVNTFPTSIRVKPGDVLGVNDENAIAVPNACVSSAALGDQYLFLEGSLADGQTGTFVPEPGDLCLNISAVLEPTNTFALGRITHNKDKGTATLEATVPNPGDLAGSGKGVKAAAAGATISESVTPGAAQLLIKAKGKKKRKLNETGKVKLNVAITYTPTGGDPSTQSVKVKLKKNG